MDADQAFIVTTSIPDDSNYVSSFGLRHYGLIFAINNYSYHLHRATAIASKSILLIRPESGLSADDFADIEGGMALEGDPESVGWLNSAMNISQWSWTMNYISELKLQLSRGFALDILSQPQFAQPRSATEVNAVQESVERSVATLVQTIQETFAINLVKAALAVIKKRPASSEDFLSEITPIVTSGTSRFDELINFQGMIQGFALSAQFDPTLAQRFNGEAILKKYASIIGVDVTDYLRPLSPEAPQPLAPQTQIPNPNQQLLG
jgi:hypothetical protein